MEKNHENLGNQQEIQEVYVCSVCETIFRSSEIYSHGCFKGYPEVHIDQNHYVYPQCEDRTIVRRSEVNGNEQIVTEPLTSTGSLDTLGSQIQNLNIEEQLILLIQEREPLWNLRSPLKHRSKENKEKLWEEVAAAIGSGYTVIGLKKKWKNLCDSYRRFVNSEKGASGSAAKKKKKWMYSDIMSFMSDMNLQNKLTDSNIISNTMMSDSNDSTMSPIPPEVLSDDETASSVPSASVPRTRKNTKNSQSDMEIGDKLQAITNSTPTNIFKFPDIPAPPSTKTPESSDDAFGTFIQCSFTEIKDERDRTKVKRALMNTLFTELEKIAERN